MKNFVTKGLNLYTSDADYINHEEKYNLESEI
jgi:hypothetical protein